MRECMLLVATIGMPERLFDLCCSLGPNFRCLLRKEKHVGRGESDPISSEITIVECGENGGEA